MPLELIPPGKRKKNRFFIARGTIAGRQFEVSTKTTDKAAAERFAAQFTARILEGGADADAERQPVGPASTFKEAAERYLELHPGETNRLRPVIKDIGSFALSAINQADIVACANRLYSKQKNSSKNRRVVTPISSVMHYAFESGWCDYLKIKRFKEDAPATRAMRRETAEKLLAGATGIMRVALIFLFGQGMRITDALQITWERLDLVEGLIYVRIGKTNEWRWKALQPDVRAALANLPGDRQGYVFPWRTRWGFYRQLKKVCKATGVHFTPHMARHSLGTWLGQKRASLKTIMDIMDHADERSSMRYQMTELPEQRAAFDLVGRIGEEDKKKA